ncbi:MAG TPA: universal stress protein [Gemmatimonadaceae bacterium]|nr:universal stress protein [Gemmatimonadaceae bacterium]
MTNVSMQQRPRHETGALVQEGPVLLATKPFNGCDAPLAVARWVATREERALHVVSVLEPTEGVVAGAPPPPSRYYADERSALAAQIRSEIAVGETRPDSLRVDVLEGPSAQTVVDAARACGARVIVVGTGRHDPIGRYVYGERALQILSRADRPVLIVPRDVVATPPTVAVVAVDFSPASVRAAHAVLPLLAPGGRLIVVHVKTGVTLKEETAGWWNDAYERRCADLFAQFIRQLPQIPDVTFESKFLRGDIVPRIVDYAAAQGAGLIACGRLGHSLVERVFVGSVSSSLVRHAACPVLVAPELPGDVAWH